MNALAHLERHDTWLRAVCLLPLCSWRASVDQWRMHGEFDLRDPHKPKFLRNIKVEFTEDEMRADLTAVVALHLRYAHQIDGRIAIEAEAFVLAGQVESRENSRS